MPHSLPNMYWTGIVFRKMTARRLAERGTCGGSRIDRIADLTKWYEYLEAELEQA
jgi:hypothetical protein